ncbi:hypothetical protein N7509_010595 [Penicillium cosmopolitanum]|uniref:Tafazzin n=1 Tax=Penicillium cosmopolitanum TaxID=1131564 RepID=A0A9X0B4P1_9EURO|nr:uncharacterized protein N7509_010595 [Penicillium cosmopolitanum]KAJ5388054.1 hypothetical protein N7509_010595 [Penicillium cosmopolitanum]
MPKKQKKSFVYKPPSTPHHSLGPSSIRQNDQSRQAAGSTTDPSVNDLISHLRRTQVSHEGPARAPSFVSPRSVHPSLRNLLHLPETPPPRPRRTVFGSRPIRPIPGPPPPASWLSGDTENSSSSAQDDAVDFGCEDVQVTHRLDRLPGIAFPGDRSFVHTLLMSMARNWCWHLDYDGYFLAQLPSHIKQLLLSYLAMHSHGPELRDRMKGLKPLFLADVDNPEIGHRTTATAGDATIIRLDLSRALGRWITLKELSHELLLSTKPTAVDSKPDVQEAVPASWEQEEQDLDLEEPTDDLSTHMPPTTIIPKAIGQGMRFKKLHYLSLAHPSSGAANWNTLLHLMSHLPTITHLSLAYWPVPTRTPNATNATLVHPTNRSLRFSYSGTDMYASMENNWAESAAILRQLSRSIYCLKWLDLEGCSDWLAAITWTGTDPDGQPYRPGSNGPEWTGSWRDVEWINLGPGFEYPKDGQWMNEISRSDTQLLARFENSESRRELSLASSIHASEQSPASPAEMWNLEHERILARFKKRRKAWEDAVSLGKKVLREIQDLRVKAKGKWIEGPITMEEVDSRRA